MDNFAIICIFLAFFAGWAASFVWQWQVKRTSLSIVRDQVGKKGREAQKEQEGELMALITDASLAFKKGKEAGENIQTTAAREIPRLIATYPTVCMKHSKKLLKMITDGGGLEGLEDLGGYF